MPAYDYECAHCGGFTAMRSMAARNDPLACPTCGGAAARTILSAPALAAMSSASRVAHATNERAAHAPKSSTTHGAGCACCGGANTPSARAADGTKAFPGKRPWMISH